jgi:tetratricopeptide (TPR) repeat protein
MATVEAICQTEGYRRMVEAIASGAIAFVGAGTSIPLGYPPWASLLVTIGEEAERCFPGHQEVLAARENPDVLVRAQAYSEAFGSDRLGQLIATIYGPKPVQFNELHKDLIAIPFLHFLTTNYEDSLEAAQSAVFGSSFHRFDFDEASKRSEFLEVLRHRAKSRYFVHLHGSIHRPQQVILTLSDYRSRYANSNDFKVALQIILSHHPVVFLGFGLKDHYVMHDLDMLTGHVGGIEPRHFAITTLAPGETEAGMRQMFEKRYGITPLFYDPHDNHKDLYVLVKKLREYTVARKAEIESETLREFVNRIFGEDTKPLTRDQALSRVPDIITPLSVAGISPVSGTTDASDRVPLDDEIDSIGKYTKEGKPSVAIAMYTGLIERPPTELSDRLRYRLYANRGNAHFARGELERAADEYLVGTSYWRSKDARALEALAYSLKGDSAKALELSVSLLTEDPAFPRAHSIRLRSLPKGSSLRAAKRSVPRNLRRDPEIAITLAGIASDEARHRLQEAYARAALARSPGWGEAWITLGIAILLSEKKRAEIDIEVGLVPKDRSRIEDAERSFTTALTVLSGEVSPQHQLAAYFNRASVRHMLGNTAGSKDDLHHAYALGPSESEVVARMAWQLEQDDDLDGALQVLERYPLTETHGSTAFVLGLVLYRRQASGDLERAAAVLSRVVQDQHATTTSAPYADLVELLSAVYVAQHDRAKAISLFHTLPESALPGGLRDGHLARLLSDGSDEEKRRGGELIIKAAQAAQSSGDWFARRQVGYFAARMDLPALAFGLLRSIVSPSRFNFDTDTLLRCARAAGEDAFILDFCGELRSHGLFRREAVSIEVETLLRCNEVEPAISLMKEWLARNPNDKEMRLNLSAVGLQRDEPNLIEPDPANLPSADDVSRPARGAAVVEVLRRGPDPAAAVFYAYTLWRKFSDDIEAQRILIGVVLEAGAGRTALAPPKSVDNMSAVTYREGGSSENRTIVVEDGPNPRATLYELGRENELVRTLWGKRPGEEPVESRRRYKVLAIENKIAYRARRCLEDFEPAFGKSGGIQRFTVPQDIVPGSDPKVVLGDMWKILSARDQQRQYLVGLYQQANLPVSALAHTLGRSVFETMAHLAGTQDLGILTSIGFDEEWKAALAASLDAREVVLDDSAVATLFLLDLHPHIRDLPIRLIVPDSALQELRDFVRRQTAPGQGTGYIAVQNDKLVIQELTPEQQEAWLQRLQDFIQTVASSCEIVGGKARLDLPPAVRQQLPEAFGYAVTDAVAIAKVRNLPLWTDDLVTAAVICAPLGIRRVWAQPVIAALEAKKPSTAIRSNAVAAKLFLLGYQFTRLSVQVVLEIFASNGWDRSNRAVSQVLAYIATVGGMGSQNCGVTSSIVAGIWLRCRKRQKAVKLTEEILEGIGRPIAGPKIARPLYRAQGPPPFDRRKWRRLQRWLRKWRCRAARPNTRSGM